MEAACFLALKSQATRSPQAEFKQRPLLDLTFVKDERTSVS